MKAWVEKVRSLASNGTLWETKIQFGDWLALDGDPNLPVGATPIPIIATAYHAQSTKILAKTAEVLGYKEDARLYNDLAQQIVAAFRAEFVTPNGNIIGGTQTSYILPLAFDLLTADMAKKAASELHRMIVANDYHLTTGFLGTPHLCNVLSKYGYHETALRLLLQEEYPSWLYQVKQGATTIWERWNSLNPDGTFNDAGMTSFNHYAYGSIAQWLYTTLAGISYDEKEPGFKKSIIAPQIYDLGIRHVKSTYETLYGELSSEWSLDNNEVTLKVRVPVNTEATVTLPSYATNIKLEQHSVNTKVFCLGSGEYKFTFLYSNILRQKINNTSVVGELKYYPKAKSLLIGQLTSFMNGQMPPHIAYEMIKGLTFKECKVTPEIGITPEEIDALMIKINEVCQQ
jgi:Bacterial alpha-L-rhamnosidase.